MIDLPLLLSWLPVSQLSLSTVFGLEAHKQVAKDHLELAFIDIECIIELELDIELLVFFRCTHVPLGCSIVLLVDFRILSFDKNGSSLGYTSCVRRKNSILVLFELELGRLRYILVNFGLGEDILLLEYFDDRLHDLHSVIYRTHLW